MKNRFALVFGVALLGLAAGCATTSSPQSDSRVAPGANLAGYSTFGWSKPAEAATIDAPLRILDVNIRDAVSAELIRRGYKEVSDDPELLVDYETVAQDKVRSKPFSIGIGMGSWGGSGGGGVSMDTSGVESYQEGRLVIHVLDAAKKQEVWYGTVAGRVDQKKLDAPSVARVVALAMQDFPSRAVTPP